MAFKLDLKKKGVKSMKGKKGDLEKVAEKAASGAAERARRKKRKKREPWVATPAAVASAVRELIEGALAKGTDNLKLAHLLRDRTHGSRKWSAVLYRLLTDAIAIQRARVIREGAAEEITWLLPEFEHVPRKLRLGKGPAIAVREATLQQLMDYRARLTKQAARGETKLAEKLAELDRLVERVSAVANGDLTVKVGAAFPDQAQRAAAGAGA